MTSGNRLADWLSRLVRVPSVSPDQAGPRAGVPGEGALARQMTAWFRDLGGEVHEHEVLPGRSNVYGIWRGRSDRWVVVDAHTDTVGVEQMTGDPFSGVVRDGRVHGRGAVDTKATLAVALALLEVMHERGHMPEPNLLIAATVDEEVGATGAPAFAAWLRARLLVPDELVVAEPTGCAPVYGHQGVLRLAFNVEGVAAHSSQPARGRNAITAAARLILALEEEQQRLASLDPSPLGPAALTVTLINGGRGINVVPDTCELSLDRRIGATETAAGERDRLAELARHSCPLPVTAAVSREIDAFYQPPESPWVRQLAAWSGREPAVAPFCTNAWAYASLARACVVLGPGSIDQAHAKEEWIEIAELEKLAAIYAGWWGIVD